MLGSLVRSRSVDVEVRDQAMSWEAFQNLFAYNGSQYQTMPFRSAQSKGLLHGCGPAFAVLDRRVSILGEARPSWQRFKKGRPDALYSTRELEILKRPWSGGTWRQLVAACEVDVASAGNSYWVRAGDELLRLDPDWVTIATGAITIEGVEVGHRLLGYLVQRSGQEGIALEPGQVAHYRPGAPTHTPFRGESWLAAVAADATSDIEMTSYKGSYLRNGAMPSIAVTYDPQITQAQLEAFVPVFASKFTGSLNAGKVMHMLGGRDVKTVGATLDQLAFKAVQGAGETRIASAAGVPSTVAGFSEGMQGSSLNAGNYGASRRLFGDAKIRPLLGDLCEAFSTIVPAPADSRLWYDDSGVAFFQEDVTDEANIRLLRAQMIRSLIEAGYDADAAVRAASTGDFDGLLGQHSGLTSVQLQPPTDGEPPAPAPTAEADQ
jgi:phage portal protein BeeE